MKVIKAMEMKSRRGDEVPHGDKDCGEDEKHFEGNVWLEAMLPPIEPNGLRVYTVAYNATAKPFNYAPGFARLDSP